MNVCIFSGNIGFMKMSQVGDDKKDKLVFSIALNKRDKNEKPSWATCVAWNGTAKFINEYFEVGKAIEVMARYDHRVRENNGNEEHYHEFVVEQVEFAKGGKGDSNGGNNGNGGASKGSGSSSKSSGSSKGSSKSAPATPNEDDDLGF